MAYLENGETPVLFSQEKFGKIRKSLFLLSYGESRDYCFIHGKVLSFLSI